MTVIDNAARVQRGIALLDQKWPAWATEINLSTLDISSGTRCVTAQYAQKHGLGSFYWTGLDALGLESEGEAYEAHGFNADQAGADYDSTFSGYKALNGLWKAAILERRSQAQGAPAEPEATP